MNSLRPIIDLTKIKLQKNYETTGMMGDLNFLGQVVFKLYEINTNDLSELLAKSCATKYNEY